MTVWWWLVWFVKQQRAGSYLPTKSSKRRRFRLWGVPKIFNPPKNVLASVKTLLSSSFPSSTCYCTATIAISLFFPLSILSFYTLLLLITRSARKLRETKTCVKLMTPWSLTDQWLHSGKLDGKLVKNAKK